MSSSSLSDLIFPLKAKPIAGPAWINLWKLSEPKAYFAKIGISKSWLYGLLVALDLPQLSRQLTI